VPFCNIEIVDGLLAVAVFDAMDTLDEEFGFEVVTDTDLISLIYVEVDSVEISPILSGVGVFELIGIFDASVERLALVIGYSEDNKPLGLVAAFTVVTTGVRPADTVVEFKVFDVTDVSFEFLLFENTVDELAVVAAAEVPVTADWSIARVLFFIKDIEEIIPPGVGFDTMERGDVFC